MTSSLLLLLNLVRLTIEDCFSKDSFVADSTPYIPSKDSLLITSDCNFLITRFWSRILFSNTVFYFSSSIYLSVTAVPVAYSDGFEFSGTRELWLLFGYGEAHWEIFWLVTCSFLVFLIESLLEFGSMFGDGAECDEWKSFGVTRLPFSSSDCFDWRGWIEITLFLLL